MLAGLCSSRPMREESAWGLSPWLGDGHLLTCVFTLPSLSFIICSTSKSQTLARRAVILDKGSLKWCHFNSITSSKTAFQTWSYSEVLGVRTWTHDCGGIILPIIYMFPTAHPCSLKVTLFCKFVPFHVIILCVYIHTHMVFEEIRQGGPYHTHFMYLCLFTQSSILEIFFFLSNPMQTHIILLEGVTLLTPPLWKVWIQHTSFFVFQQKRSRAVRFLWV